MKYEYLLFFVPCKSSEYLVGITSRLSVAHVINPNSVYVNPPEVSAVYAHNEVGILSSHIGHSLQRIFCISRYFKFFFFKSLKIR